MRKNIFRKRGFHVATIHKKYSVNENLMGATISGSEIDLWEEPSDETYVLCNLPHKYPKKVTKLEITFSEGEGKISKFI